MTQNPVRMGWSGTGFARWRWAVCAAVLVGGWGASGVTSVGFFARGIYERFGAPVAVLHPGVHLVMPWPFGRVRRLDFGAVQVVDVPGLRVLYRVGLSDSEAMDAAYGSADPDRIVQASASDAMIALPAASKEAMQDTIQAALDRAASGLQVVGVLPRPEAGNAGPDVQAAQIAAAAVLDEARGEAAVERARARLNASTMVAAARAKAAEIVAAARTAMVQFDGDRAANKDGKVFLLERYFADLTQAIGTAPKTIIDHRLNWPTAPELDLRPPPGIAPGGKG